MLPMLTLGIPGSPTTAILLGGHGDLGPRARSDALHRAHGLRVGDSSRASTWRTSSRSSSTLLSSPRSLRFCRLPFTILAPVIFILCLVGGYAPTQDMHDVWLMFLFGVVGYLLRKLDYPMAPAVLAIVLGPLAETSMRQSLLISHGSPAIFFERPDFRLESWWSPSSSSRLPVIRPRSAAHCAAFRRHVGERGRPNPLRSWKSSARPRAVSDGGHDVACATVRRRRTEVPACRGR